jgi:hypothetical protein
MGWSKRISKVIKVLATIEYLSCFTTQLSYVNLYTVSWCVQITHELQVNTLPNIAYHWRHFLSFSLHGSILGFCVL